MKASFTQSVSQSCEASFEEAGNRWEKSCSDRACFWNWFHLGGIDVCEIKEEFAVLLCSYCGGNLDELLSRIWEKFMSLSSTFKGDVLVPLSGASSFFFQLA